LKSKHIAIAAGAALAALALIVLVVPGVTQAAKPDRELAAAAAPGVVYRSAPAGWVLYTVSRGGPAAAVAAFRDLVAVREEMGLEPADDTGTFVYLNGPVAASDQLIEVQLPVAGDPSGLRGRVAERARQAGLGTSDVKALPSRVEATIAKSAGVSSPGPLYNRLYSQITSDRLTSLSAPSETFSEAEAIPETCAYDELETTISVTVK
jgi:hypothetical protein